MNVNNFNYLYNAQGQTIAVKKNSEEGQQKGGNTVNYNGEEWVKIDSSADLSNAKTVNDLGVEQITKMFEQGNLTVGELEKWVKTHEVKNLKWVNPSANQAEVEFTYQNIKYSISCTWDACEFQTDNTQSVSSVQSSQLSVPTGAFLDQTSNIYGIPLTDIVPQKDVKEYKSTNNENWMSFSGIKIPMRGYIDKNNPGTQLVAEDVEYVKQARYIYEHYLTNEQKAFCDNNVEKDGYRAIYNVQFSEEQKLLMNSDPNIFCCYTVDGKNVHTRTLTDPQDTWLAQDKEYNIFIQHGLSYTADELWNNLIETFKRSFYLKDRYNYASCGTGVLSAYSPATYPSLEVELEDNNVRFSDKTISKIKEFLTNLPDEPSEKQLGYMEVFGFSRYDSEEAIKEKVRQFCGNDDLTMDVETYYTKITSFEDPSVCIRSKQVYQNILNSLKEAISINVNDYQMGYGDTFGLSFDYRLDENGNLVKNDDGKYLGMNYTFDSDGNKIWLDDTINENRYKYKNFRGSTADKINEFGSYLHGKGKFDEQHPMSAFFALGGSGDNIVLDANFKNKFAQCVAEYEKQVRKLKEISDSESEEFQTQLSFVMQMKQEFEQMFDLFAPGWSSHGGSGFYGATEFINLLNDESSYTEFDPNAFSDMISAFCKNIGSNDGKTVNLNNFYESIVNYDYDQFHGDRFQDTMNSVIGFSLLVYKEDYAKPDLDINWHGTGRTSSAQTSGTSVPSTSTSGSQASRRAPQVSQSNAELATEYPAMSEFKLNPNEDIIEQIDKIAQIWEQENENIFKYQLSDILDEIKRQNLRILNNQDHSKIGVQAFGESIGFDFWGYDHIYEVGNTSNVMLNLAIKNAAGITGTESLEEQNNILETFFKQFGNVERIQGLVQLEDWQGVSLCNLLSYLVGNNPAKINYVQKAEADIIAENNERAANYVSYTLQDIQEAAGSSGIGGTTAIKENDLEANFDNDQMAETRKLFQQIDEILLKQCHFTDYYSMHTRSQYFGNGASHNSLDDPYYNISEFTWTDKSAKEALLESVNKAMSEFAKEHADELISLVYDGCHVFFTTNDGYTHCVQGHNASHSYSAGENSNYNGVYEPTTYTPISYLDTKVYSTKAPNELPAYDKPVFKTAWDGICISTDGMLFIWDPKANKYIKHQKWLNPDNNLIMDLIKGDISRFGDIYDRLEGSKNIELLIFAHLFGYNITENPHIFEKDGELYTIDSSQSGGGTPDSLCQAYVISQQPDSTGLDILKAKLVKLDNYNSQGVKSAGAVSFESASGTESPASSQSSANEYKNTIIDGIFEKDGKYFELNDGSYIELTGTKAEKAKFTIAPDELLTTDEYKNQVEEHSDELKEIAPSAIKVGNEYSSVMNGTKYNFLWNPYTQKFEKYTSSELEIQKEYDEHLQRISMIRQVLLQGLFFTVNPKVAKDRDGNYWDYDEASKKFIKRSL